MNPDSPARVFSLVAAALFILARGAAGLTIDLDKNQDSPTHIAYGVAHDTKQDRASRNNNKRVQFNELMDVKIIDRSALVRTENPAELIILTEKRKADPAARTRGRTFADRNHDGGRHAARRPGQPG